MITPAQHAHWTPRVWASLVSCANCGLHIQPGHDWTLNQHQRPIHPHCDAR